MLPAQFSEKPVDLNVRAQTDEVTKWTHFRCIYLAGCEGKKCTFSGRRPDFLSSDISHSRLLLPIFFTKTVVDKKLELDDVHHFLE